MVIIDGYEFTYNLFINFVNYSARCFVRVVLRLDGLARCATERRVPELNYTGLASIPLFAARLVG